MFFGNRIEDQGFTVFCEAKFDLSQTLSLVPPLHLDKSFDDVICERPLIICQDLNHFSLSAMTICFVSGIGRFSNSKLSLSAARMDFLFGPSRDLLT